METRRGREGRQSGNDTASGSSSSVVWLHSREVAHTLGRRLVLARVVLCGEGCPVHSGPQAHEQQSRLGDIATPGLTISLIIVEIQALLQGGLSYNRSSLVEQLSHGD